MNTYEKAERLADMLVKSRTKAGKSQDYMAKALGVSKKTIQNWEAGTASPNLRTTCDWFDAIGVPMYPYFMAYLVGKDVKHSDNEEQLRDMLNEYIQAMTEHAMRELLYFLYSNHGSSPAGVMELITAYLHIPLTFRIGIAEQIITAYEICEAKGLLINMDNTMPDIEVLSKMAESAKDAVINQKNAYISKEEICE